MAGKVEARTQKQVVRTVLLGVTTLVLYILLFTFEEEVLAASSAGGWSFIVPVAIAFLFSYVHGTFTAEFWDTLGIKAKK